MVVPQKNPLLPGTEFLRKTRKGRWFCDYCGMFVVPTEIAEDGDLEVSMACPECLQQEEGLLLAVSLLPEPGICASPACTFHATITCVTCYKDYCMVCVDEGNVCINCLASTEIDLDLSTEELDEETGTVYELGEENYEVPLELLKEAIVDTH